MPTAADRLISLGLTLPTPMDPPGAFVLARRTGDQLHLAGHGPIAADGALVTGKVGADVSIDEARDAARLTGLQLLASIDRALGSLDEVTAVVRLFGMVNCAPGFNQTPTVIDGASQLFLDVFGPEIGAHARSAVGMAELPFDICVEIEAVVAVR